MAKRLIEEDIGYRLYKKEIYDACVIQVTAGTTGYQGGDAGHGGSTYIKITDMGGGDINFHVVDNEEKNYLSISLYGDAELNVMIKGLEWIVKKLKKNRGKR